MARIRSVHPDICTSETMAALPADIERTYVRLWTHCDDYGRCADNPKLIKAAIYPLHDDMTLEIVNEHLDRLVVGRHLTPYEVDSRKFLQVREWTKYQHPQRPAQPKIPAYDPSARCARDARKVQGGDMETYAQEGRGDCADKSATVPANPSRLSEVKRTLSGANRASA